MAISKSSNRTPNSKLQKSIRLYSDWYVHERMLADIPRMQAYAEAVKRYVKPTHVVLDLGTGSGILAMLAAQAGARRVFAVDRTDIVETARHVALANGFPNIEFIQSESSKLDLPEKVDIIVQEQMGHTVDQEEMIAKVVDVRLRLLKPGGRILPNRFQVFLEPVQLRSDKKVPFLWEQKVGKIDFSSLKPNSSSNEPWGSNWKAKHRFKYIQSGSIQSVLSRPRPLFEFNLETIQPDERPTRISYCRTINRAGRLDGLCFFWRGEFGEDDDVVIDRHPEATASPYHWRYLLYRTEAENVAKGQEINFNIVAPELSNCRSWTLIRGK